MNEADHLNHCFHRVTHPQALASILLLYSSVEVVDDESRNSIGQQVRYIELHEKLCELDRHIKDLELAAEFAEQWGRQIQ
jgi:hypothetical protein